MDKKMSVILVFIFLAGSMFLTGCGEQDAIGRPSTYFNCNDNDGGWNYNTTGNVTLEHATRDDRVRTDYCRNDIDLLEYNCKSDSVMSNRVIDCSEEFGENVTCQGGRCI